MSVKYSKFDSFLKRTLSNKEYKNVKIYEPCVVNSSREKRAFRFTFLTDDKLYFTENPPKSLLYHVSLKHVVEVNLLHDTANFLQPGLRESVQHVLIKFNNLDKEKNASSSANKLSPNDSSNSLSASTFSSQYLLKSSDQPSSSQRLVAPTICASTNVAEVHETRSKNGSLDSSSVGSHSANTWSLLKSGLKWKNSVKSSKWVSGDPSSTHVLNESMELASGQPSNIENLHLYILNENTTFFLMLQSVWRNYIIYHSKPCQDERNGFPQATVNFDELEISSKPSFGSDDNIRTLFSDLKHELRSAQAVEHVYGLYNELKIAVQQEVLIKVLFWQDESLFKCSIRWIKTCVLESVASNVESRADEIELAILILQTMSLMMRETEAIPQCYRVLQSINLPNLKDIIECLLSSPTLVSSWKKNEELVSLISEYTVSSAEVMYELFVASQQMTWLITGKSPAFCTGVLFQQIRQSQHLCSYLDRVIESCRELWNPNLSKIRLEPKSSSGRSSSLIQGEALSPENVIQAFHIFYVVHKLITVCDLAGKHAKENFKEEFRYYIHPNSVPVKFPPDYPISGMARAVAHAVGAYVVEES